MSGENLINSVSPSIERNASFCSILLQLIISSSSVKSIDLISYMMDILQMEISIPEGVSTDKAGFPVLLFVVVSKFCACGSFSRALM